MIAEAFRTTSGDIYAVRVWRIVLYVDKNKGHFGRSLRSGGIICNWKGKRLLARHWRGCISLLPKE